MKHSFNRVKSPVTLWEAAIVQTMEEIIAAVESQENT